MDRQLKQRVVGAAVLVALGVIFIPLLLDHGTLEAPPGDAVEIPPAPTAAFEPGVEPLDEAAIAELEQRASNRIELPGGDDTGEDAGYADASGTAMAVDDAVPAATPPADAPAAPSPATKTADASAAAEAKPAPAVTAPAPRPATPPAADAGTGAEARPAPPAGGGDPAWTVQLGSFSGEENATRLRDKLRAAGYPAYVEKRVERGALLYKVRVGPQGGRSAAEQVRGRLAEQFQLKGMLLHYP